MLNSSKSPASSCAAEARHPTVKVGVFDRDVESWQEPLAKTFGNRTVLKTPVKTVLKQKRRMRRRGI